jgi:2-polyprenyl-3-methyl-5-hydroxy-6-metoxy-1,4-benzoquinol methylase
MTEQRHLAKTDMYHALEEIHRRPEPFSHFTAADLWTDEHTSRKMLEFHLNGSIDVSSRNTEFIDRSATWISSHFDLCPEKSIADFGCGPGLYTSRLAASGALVTGIDFSERSIRYARDLPQQQGRPVEYHHGSYLEFESAKRFDLITMIMCDYCALSPDQRLGMLDRFRKHLKPGGAVLLDVYSLTAFDAKKEEFTYARNLLDGFWSAAPYFGFMCAFKYDKEKVSLDKYTIIEETRTRVIYNWLQYFDPESLKREFEGSGLVVEVVLGDVAGGAYDPAATEFAVIARGRRGS